MEETIWKKLRKLQPGDLLGVLFFFLAWIPAVFYRKKHPKLWLICEKGGEACDNGYWFFRYLCLQHPETDAVYAIAGNAKDREKVKTLGRTVPFGSLRHWILYLAAENNISSQKDGKPNAAVCYFLEVVSGLLKNRRIFLQHGVIKDDLPYLHEKNAKYRMFCCSAEKEYRFVRDTFGYPEGVVQNVGLCRFDPLFGQRGDPRLILIAPTWRMDLQRNGSRTAFLKSSYYRNWNALLQDRVFLDMLVRTDRHAVFCVHRNMARFEASFSSDSPRLRVLPWSEAEIGDLIAMAGLLITDYSSIFMDFAYMQKPILYYQPDYAEYRKKHLPEGYFDYIRDGFGPVCTTTEELLAGLETIVHNGNALPQEYADRAQEFFTYHDDRSCERTYMRIMEL